MPRYAHTQLRWSEPAQTYVLSIGDQEQSRHRFTSDWLEQIASFAFHSRSRMHYTVRKQRGQRGTSYWYGYRRLHGRVVKRYLGRTADLTLARLEEIARLLEIESDSPKHSVQPRQDTGLPQAVPGVAGEALYPALVGAFPLLLSKLSPPRLHPFLLDRSRLFALLDAGGEGTFTLLSAPAGFGKTTLVCQWIEARRPRRDFPPVAWVSLEAADNDPLRFWRYLIAACQTFSVDLQEVQSALTAATPQPPFLPSELSTVLTTLLNTLARCSSGGILVLEDYHLVTEPLIHEMLSFFLEHLPATLHLIMTTRSDPPFSLTRLRTRNVLYEVRTADLRFLQEETSILLHHSLPFPLDASIIQRLHAQLQGWGAGLHLMKLALQRTTSPAEGEHALALFSRNNAALQDYFATEVLALQPEPVQQFLLQTSMLSCLTASLCDAVIEQTDSQDMLTLLERANVFLEQLDCEPLHLPQALPPWYHYHALFAESLRNEARRRLGEDHMHYLSLRASRWYEGHGYLDEAIDASLDAQENTRAAILIERSIEAHTFPGEIYEPHTLQCWLEQLPETLLEQYPILCLGYSATLLFQNAAWLPNESSLRAIEKLLQSAEQQLSEEKNLPKLGELAAFRSLLAMRQGDMRASHTYAKQALDWLAQTQHTWRGITLCVVGEEWITRGAFQQARAVLLEAHAHCSTGENHYFKRIAITKLAQVYFELGESQQAASLFRQALAASTDEEKLAQPLANWRCIALLGLAALCYEGNELERADQLAQEALTLSQSHAFLHHDVHATLLRARLQQAQGQSFVAQQLLVDLFDKVPVSQPVLVREIQTAQAQIALASGDQITVQRWATGRVPQPAFSEELLFSRWLRVQGKLEEATQQLERLLGVAQQMGQTRRALEIQVEMVLVEVAGKRKAEAQHLLSEVLAQAFDRNAIRLFLNAGEQMALLLRSLLPHMHGQPLLASIRALLSAFPTQQHLGNQASLIEPLSPQELRVLHLLVQHCSNADIASELVVSINTIRSQVQSIYSKLGVHTRSAASDVARELHLLGDNPDVSPLVVAQHP